MFRYLKYTKEYTVSRILTHKPVILTHFITSKCNCRCKICDIWTKKPSQEMKTMQIKTMLSEAKKLHFFAYVVWGGEPLLRADTIEIFQYAHKLGLYTSLITNGTLLPEKAPEIAKYVDLTWVSLDYPSNYHDELRNLKGTFESVIEGIRQLKNLGGKVAVNCVLSKLNADKKVIKNMVEIAQKLRVGIAFDPMEVFSDFNERYALSKSQRSDLFSQILELKKSGYPILNSHEFINYQINPTNYSCAQPEMFLNIRENGEIVPFWCRKNNRVLGDLRRQSLITTLFSKSYSEFVKNSRGCSYCNNSVTVETSLFYKPYTAIANSFRIPSPIVEFISFYSGLVLPNAKYGKKLLKRQTK
jgi:MoaA/NifB/PqqE/SkfB family radical SAM enzyme